MAQSDAWSPSQYEKFKAERAQPFFDLMALVRVQPQMRVVDLGCGTGELTRHLHVTWKARETLGLDRSAKMLARSDELAGSGLRFRQGDIESFSGVAEWDVVFSNAALHWVQDHPGLFARLRDALAPGGQLAIQLPLQRDGLSHRLAVALSQEAPFADKVRVHEPLAGVLDPEAYAVLLHRLGFAEQQVRVQVYGHLLESREGVLEWVKGTLLTHYQQELGPELFDLFLQRYRERLLPQLEDARPYFFPFKRLFLWARK